MAIAHLGDVVEGVTPLTPEDLEVRPNLPIDFPPGDPVSFSDEGDKFLQIPGPVDNMLGPNLSVMIDVGFTLGTMEHFPLAHSEELVAECALVEVIPFLLEEQLEFLHEQPRD